MMNSEEANEGNSPSATSSVGNSEVDIISDNGDYAGLNSNPLWADPDGTDTGTEESIEIIEPLTGKVWIINKSSFNN